MHVWRSTGKKMSLYKWWAGRDDFDSCCLRRSFDLPRLQMRTSELQIAKHSRVQLLFFGFSCLVNIFSWGPILFLNFERSHELRKIKAKWALGTPNCGHQRCWSPPVVVGGACVQGSERPSISWVILCQCRHSTILATNNGQILFGLK